MSALCGVEGLTPDPAPPPRETTFVFLAGDSFPKDRYIETALARRLPGTFIGHSKTLKRYNQGQGVLDLAVRVDIMRRLLAGRTPGSVVLIGRSSGARVATLIAAETGADSPVRAVACLCYPFRRPQSPPEPERYDHLATLRLPVLILQGRRDAYGGASVARDYPLSRTVRHIPVDADHRMRLPPEGWDMAAQAVLDLAASASPDGTA